MGYAFAAYLLVGLVLGTYGVRLALRRRRLEAARAARPQQNPG